MADKLADFYISGDKVKQAIIKDEFSGDAIKLHNEWASPLIAYFRANPDELGESRLLSLVPDNRDLILFGVADAQGKVTDPSTVYSLLALQLENLRKLIGEFLR